MKTLLPGCVAGLFLLTACAPKPRLPVYAAINQEGITSVGSPMLFGRCTRSALERNPYRTWFETAHQAYSVDTAALAAFRPLPPDVEIAVFFGTWCGDSRREVPRLVKVLDFLKAQPAQVQFIALDSRYGRYKQSPGQEQRGLGIFRQPTFVVRRQGEEIGRIVQHPVETLEKDLARLLTGTAYEPAFGASWKLYQRFKRGQTTMTEAEVARFASENRSTLSNIYALDGFGFVLASEGRYAEALTVYRINALCFPNDAIAFNSLGDVYRQTGRSRLATANYRKALALDPDMENPRKWLGLKNDVALVR